MPVDPFRHQTQRIACILVLLALFAGLAFTFAVAPDDADFSWFGLATSRSSRKPTLNSTRLLIPLWNPALQLPGRWSAPPQVPMQNLSIGLTLGPDSSLSPRNQAVSGWNNALAILRVTNTKTLSIHAVPGKGRVRVFLQTLPRGKGTSHSLGRRRGVFLATHLDPVQNYTFLVRFIIPRGNTIVLRGFGLDSTGSLLPSPPRSLVVEWLGDSISAMHYPRPSGSVERGNFIVEACRLLNITDCPILARSGFGVRDMTRVYDRIGPATRFKRYKPDQPKYRPAVAVSNLGTNDQIWAQGNGSEFVEAYVGLLRNVMTFYGERNMRIIVLAPFGFWDGVNVRPTIELGLLREVVRRLGGRTKLVDSKGWLTPLNAGRYMLDAVHPSAEGQVFFGARVAEALRELGVWGDASALG